MVPQLKEKKIPMRFHGGKPPIFRSWSGTPEGSGRISLGISIHVAHVSEALSR